MQSANRNKAGFPSAKNISINSKAADHLVRPVKKDRNQGVTYNKESIPFSVKCDANWGSLIFTIR